ncbi:endonuclease/exonuclease/phosphatase family protein [Streptomyces chartreusis]|uniref:endonuclease/exonuclease/phosphatase family protein n=1 Tax=Streptomyces chartreusis TaxID=1969 RepID=UPI0037F9260E
MPAARSSQLRCRTAALAVLLSGLAGSTALTGLPAAHAAPSTGAVIAEVYGGGGNAGATLTSDFVELANAGSDAYNLAGYSVQYLSGAPSASSRWSVTALAGAIAPGSRYLVAEAAGTGGVTPLPTPDASGSIAMSATTGTVALVNGTTPLTCLTAAACATEPRVVDVIGYGTAVVHEGSGPAVGASNTISVARDASLTDTDDNASDFTSGVPSPVNASGQGTGGSQDPPPTPEPSEPGPVRIHDIQGHTRVSPFNGQTVTRVPGIVTGVRATGSRGYWIQDREVDTDPRTSEAIFVYTGSATPTVAIGDKVLVTGRVTEYYPGGATQSVTEITNAAATVLSAGNALPVPVTLKATTIPTAYAPSAAGSSTEGLPLSPTTCALDFYEAHEGERAQFADARVTGPTTKYREVWVTVKPAENPTRRGGTFYGSYSQPNTGRLKVMSIDPATAIPSADVGDTLAGTTMGPIDYDGFGGYSLQATRLGTLVDNPLKRETTRKQTADELAIATFNVENLDPADPAEKFTRLANGIVTHLSSPDIVALEEIQDNNGATDSGTVAANQTVEKFVAAIHAAGGPRYSWRSVDPTNNTDGGEPGGNIRQVFLFNSQRVQFTDRAGGDATTAVRALQSSTGLRLSASPGRINPTSEAWSASRKPLAGEFRFRDKPVFVIANHFNSKGGDQPLHSRNQPPLRSSETQRMHQAVEVNTFVKSLLAIDADAKVVVLGDLNDYEFSGTMSALTSDGVLKNLITTLPASERYTYVFEGNSQALDHILLSPALSRFNYDVVHINAEFSDQSSDHDPQIVRVNGTDSW